MVFNLSKQMQKNRLYRIACELLIRAEENDDLLGIVIAIAAMEMHNANITCATS